MDIDVSARRAGWRLLRGAVRPHWRWIVAGIVAGIVWAVARVSVPRLAGNAVDSGIAQGDASAIAGWVVAIVCVGLVQALATGARRFTAFRMAHRVETDLRMRLAAQLQRLHFGFHDHAQTGHLMANAQTDVQQIFMVLLLIPLTIASTLTGVLVIVLLVTTDPVLALVALGALPFLNISAARFTKRMHPVSLALQDELGQLSGVVEESVTGVRAVKGFGAEDLQMARLDREADDVYAQAMAQAQLRAKFLPVVDLLPMLGLVGILWWGGHAVIEGDLTVGTILEANAYVVMLIWPLRMVGMLLGQIPRAGASAGRVNRVIATDTEIRDPQHPTRLPDGPGEVRFEHVDFAYGAQSPVLCDFDLTIRGGESIALVGATGSGKSTVVRLLPRFYDVSAGAIRIDGVDVRELAVRDVRRAVGLVPEDTFLFSDTVRANIAYADPDADDATVERAARLSGAHDFVAELPDGYTTIVGEQGFSLSGGQRQRIAIARAILADPRVLVLDDATSAVDPSKEHEIRAAMREVMAGRTTIIIAHRPATIALADRVVLVDEGRAADTGTHSELLARSPRYREVLARAETREPDVSVPTAPGGD